MPERGQIEDALRKKQLVDYSQIRYGKITPTDVDGAFEIQGKLFVFIELKLRDTPVKPGQQWFLEQLQDNLNKPSLIIVAQHCVDDKQTTILAHECVVRCYRSRGVWITPPKPRLLKEVLDRFVGGIIPKYAVPTTATVTEEVTTPTEAEQRTMNNKSYDEWEAKSKQGG